MADTVGGGPGPAKGAALAFQFSTDAFRKRERVAAWREVFGRAVLNIDVAPSTEDDFRARATVFRSGTFGMIRAETSPVEQSNSHSLISNDDISFCCVLNSPWSATQSGRNTDLGLGDGVLMSNGEIGKLSFFEASSYVAFGLPKAQLAALVPDHDALLARRIPAGNHALRLLLGYLSLAQGDAFGCDAALDGAFADHVCDLLALALGATRDAAEVARRRGLPAARLEAIKDDIRKAYRRPDLSIHAIAARHGVSARYVQRIFEETGATFTQYLMEQRLLAAYKALRRTGSAVLPISMIALESGFSDVSHFNRLFRQRFGCTPNEVRKAAKT